MLTLASTIKHFREKKGYSQEEFAQKMSVLPSDVSDWEKGVSTPRIKWLRQIASILDISVADLSSIAGMARSTSRVAPTGSNKAGEEAINTLWTPIPYLSKKGQTRIPDIADASLSWIDESYPVVVPEELKGKTLLVIEVEGDSMEPGIKHGASVLACQVPASEITRAVGAVYAVLYANQCVIKRIKTNELAIIGTLLLHADNEKYSQTLVYREYIQGIWKVIGKVWETVE